MDGESKWRAKIWSHPIAIYYKAWIPWIRSPIPWPGFEPVHHPCILALPAFCVPKEKGKVTLLRARMMSKLTTFPAVRDMFFAQCRDLRCPNEDYDTTRQGTKQSCCQVNNAPSPISQTIKIILPHQNTVIGHSWCRRAPPQATRGSGPSSETQAGSMPQVN